MYSYPKHVAMRATGGISIPACVLASATRKYLKKRRNRKRALRYVADFVVESNPSRF